MRNIRISHLLAAVMLLFAVLLGGALVTGVPAAVAQDDEPDLSLDTLCTDQGRADMLTVVRNTLDSFEADPDAPNTLVAAQLVLATYRANCELGLVFTSDEFGLDWVSDPIVFPDGAFRVTFEAVNGGAGFNLEGLDGDCDFSVNSIIAEGETSQDFHTFEGCVAVLDTAQYGADSWTLTFEPVVTTGD